MPKLGVAAMAGGNMTLFSMMVLERLIRAGLRFDCISGYSAAGCLMASLARGSIDQQLEMFFEALDQNEQNFYLQNVFRRGEHPFPHETIYGNLVRDCIDIQALKAFPIETRLICSYVKATKRTAPVKGVIASAWLMSHLAIRKFVRANTMRGFSKVFRARGEVLDLRQLDDPDEVFFHIMGSSTIYPCIKLRRNGTHVALDGMTSGITPLEVLDDCDYVLSIQGRPSKRHHERVIELCPRRPLDVNPLDYKGSTAARRAYDRGIEDGEYYVNVLKNTPFFIGEAA